MRMPDNPARRRETSAVLVLAILRNLRRSCWRERPLALRLLPPLLCGPVIFVMMMRVANATSVLLGLEGYLVVRRIIGSW